jgi:hypothetical protein
VIRWLMVNSTVNLGTNSPSRRVVNRPPLRGLLTAATAIDCSNLRPLAFSARAIPYSWRRQILWLSSQTWRTIECLILRNEREPDANHL